MFPWWRIIFSQSPKIVGSKSESNYKFIIFPQNVPLDTYKSVVITPAIRFSPQSPKIKNETFRKFWKKIDQKSPEDIAALLYLWFLISVEFSRKIRLFMIVVLLVHLLVSRTVLEIIVTHGLVWKLLPLL